VPNDPLSIDGAASQRASPARIDLSRKLHWSEIVIVVALFLVLLLFIVILRVQHIARQTQAGRITAISECQGLLGAIDAFSTDTGRYPTAAEGLTVLISNTPSIQGWHGPYVKSMPNDPWGRSYVYTAPNSPATKPDVQSPRAGRRREQR
jgi:type II secretion system protein G